MPKFKITIFDADVGGNVHEELFSECSELCNEVDDVVNSYELEEEYADAKEINDNALWFPQRLLRKVKDMIYSPFFDSVSVWFPGHHRKIKIEKIEENN